MIYNFPDTLHFRQHYSKLWKNCIGLKKKKKDVLMKIQFQSLTVDGSLEEHCFPG